MDTASGIVSLLPSATEMLYELGLGDRVVAVSHECDYPQEVRHKPRATFSHIDSSQSSSDIDIAVQQKLSTDQPLYGIDISLLSQIEFDLVITQSKCEVCALKYEDVVAAVDHMGRIDQVSMLALQPQCMEDVFDDLIRIGQVCGIENVAETKVQQYRQRVDFIASRLASLGQEERPRTALIEWIEPVMLAGNWMPEMLRIAGGRGPSLDASGKSLFTTWETISAFNPEVVVFCPCGFDLPRTCDEARALQQPEFFSLPAVRDGSVYAVDGNAYFNRSGPRLVESLEILAHVLHPQKIGPPALSSPAERAWCRVF